MRLGERLDPGQRDVVEGEHVAAGLADHRERHLRALAQAADGVGVLAREADDHARWLFAPQLGEVAAWREPERDARADAAGDAALGDGDGQATVADVVRALQLMAA